MKKKELVALIMKNTGLDPKTPPYQYHYKRFMSRTKLYLTRSVKEMGLMK